MSKKRGAPKLTRGPGQHPTPFLVSLFTAEEATKVRVGASMILEKARVPHLLFTQAVTKRGDVHVGFSYWAMGDDGARSLCEDLREVLRMIDPDMRRGGQPN